MSPAQIQAAAVLELKRRRGEYLPKMQRLHQYRDDPAGFGIDLLNEYYTPDITKVMESVRDYRVTIAKSANSTGKTHMAGRVALWFYMMYDDAQVYTCAAPPERNLRTLLWGEISSAMSHNASIMRGHESKVMKIYRPVPPPATEPSSFIIGVSIPMTGTPEQRESRFSGKHAGHLLFIVDEGDAVPEEVYKGIESCMSSDNARMLIMLNPRRKAGTVWRIERDGLANVIELSAFAHPNVIYGENRIPGAVSREVTVRRINEWTRPLTSEERPSDKCFQVPSFLVGATATNAKGQPYPPLQPGYREVTEPAFWYMVLGQYPQQDETQLISQEWINNARARWDAYVAVNGMMPPKGVQPTMGLDVGEFGPDPNVACFRYGGWVAPFVAWNGMDTDAVATKAAELYKEKACAKANVDATGYGSNVAPKMSRNGCSAVGVKVGENPTDKPEGLDADFYQLRDQLWWACREWLRTDPGAMLPPDEMLIEELLAPTFSYFGKKMNLKVMSKDTMKDILKRSPDRADALCLTLALGAGWSVGSVQLRR
jgi:hypothetical protein